MAWLYPESPYRHLKPKGTETPCMEGLPKIHKPAILLRVTLCMHPYHQTIRWLVDILNPICKFLTPHCTKKYFEISSILENIPLDSHEIFSIHVNSLFTTVLLHETTDYCSYDYISSSFTLTTEEKLLYYATIISDLISRAPHTDKSTV